MTNTPWTAVTEVLKDWVRAQIGPNSDAPLFVALQGPQGSGKSYLSARLQSELATGPTPLRVEVLSIDDLYLCHEGLVSLADTHAHNRLLHGRGQPGTHDVSMGIQIVSSLKSGTSPVKLPRFDKSLFNGEGDRLPEEAWTVVHQPPLIDVVILEGWCVGFKPITDAQLDIRWKLWEEELKKLQISDTLCSKGDVSELNAFLKQYSALWDLFDVNIQLGLPPVKEETDSIYSVIYDWRLEQEHYMKATNGGKGMSDEAVKRFVDRYIPGYVFFSGGNPSLDDVHTVKKSPMLTLTTDKNRGLLGVAKS